MKKVVFCLFAVTAIIGIEGCSPVDDHNVYFERCSQTAENGSCTDYTAGGKATFRTLQDQSKVIYWDDSQPDPKAYHNCSIIDAENWNCEETNPIYKSVHFPVHMRKGKISPGWEDTFISSLGTQQISMVKWWWLKLSAFFYLPVIWDGIIRWGWIYILLGALFWNWVSFLARMIHKKNADDQPKYGRYPDDRV